MGTLDHNNNMSSKNVGFVEPTLPNSMSPKEYELEDKDFSNISQFVYQLCGIVLRPEKKVMVHSRLVRRLQALNLSSFSTYYDLLKSNAGKDEITHLLNAITTNLTRFFREEHHFEHFKHKVLKPFIDESRHTDSSHFRVWSAGCSSGEEPYSLAMSALSVSPSIGSQINFKILATDIDTNMVSTGKNGLYKSSEGISADFLSRFCDAHENGKNIKMRDVLKNLITFNVLNLLGPWPMKGAFDVIFCRNVVIYFDKPTQKSLFDRYANALKPGGWLYIGHSESLYNVTDRFEQHGQTVYRRTH